MPFMWTGMKPAALRSTHGIVLRFSGSLELNAPAIHHIPAGHSAVTSRSAGPAYNGGVAVRRRGCRRQRGYLRQIDLQGKVVPHNVAVGEDDRMWVCGRMARPERRNEA